MDKLTFFDILSAREHGPERHELFTLRPDQFLEAVLRLSVPEKIRAVYENIAKSADLFYFLPDDPSRYIMLPNAGEKSPYNCITDDMRVFFAPQDRNFLGLIIPLWPRALQVAAPYASVTFSQCTGHSADYFSVESSMECEVPESVNPSCKDRYPVLSRTEIRRNLDFLLGFTPL